MAKNKQQKQEIIKDLNQKLKEQKSMVLVDFSGLNAKLLFKLKDELKQSGCLLKVVKKTLFKKALDNRGEKNISEKIDQIKGQIALTFGFEDEVIPAKICRQFAEKNEQLKILGGILDQNFLTKERVIELAGIPSRQELLTRLLGSLQGTAMNFVYLLQGNTKGLITVLSKIKQ